MADDVILETEGLTKEFRVAVSSASAETSCEKSL